MSIICDYFPFNTIYDLIFWFFLSLTIIGGAWFWWVETRPAPKDQFLQDPTQGDTR